MELSQDHLRRYSVAGFGRVGTYASAKQSNRCRARRCWMVTVFDSRYKDPSKPMMGKIGSIPVPRLGKHKTKKAAIARFVEFAQEVSGQLHGDLNGYPTLNVDNIIETELTKSEREELFSSI